MSSRLFASPWPVLVAFLVWLLFGLPGCLSAPNTLSNVVSVALTAGFAWWFCVRYHKYFTKKIKEFAQ